jgi:hypothetical protein
MARSVRFACRVKNRHSPVKKDRYSKLSPRFHEASIGGRAADRPAVLISAYGVGGKHVTGCLRQFAQAPIVLVGSD